MACWGNPKGSREFGVGRDGGGFGEGEISSRATWDQSGRDRTTQREEFQVSERGIKGESKGNQQGEQKDGIAPYLYFQSVYVYIVIV
jgi:hypothetical protein